MGCKVLQSTIVAEVTRACDWGASTCTASNKLNALRDKSLKVGHTRLFSMCTATENGL